MRTVSITYVILLFVLVGCDATELNTKTFANVDDYREWVSNPENKIFKTKEIGGFEISVRYVPTDLLVYQEIGENQGTPKEIDSLREYYSKSLTFVMTLSPNDDNGGDITYHDVSNYSEYSEQFQYMNFEIEQDIKLLIDDAEFNPVLSTMENVYSIKNSRDFIFVFSPDKGNSEMFFNGNNIEFIYEDHLLDIGVNRFKYDRKTLNNIPKLEFTK